MDKPYTVVDLFSGCGGLSYGFFRHNFKIIAAVDAEVSKPSAGRGRSNCNTTYEINLGIKPLSLDILTLEPEQLSQEIQDLTPPPTTGALTVLLCSPPCTDFSRAKPQNHGIDSINNSLVVKCAEIVEALLPEFVVLENARKLIRGNHSHHYKEFKNRLECLGYRVEGGVYMLDKYGLPQKRERAIVIASRSSSVKTLDDLWDGWKVKRGATTVRHAIGYLARRPIEAGKLSSRDPMHRSPGLSDAVHRRIDAIPKNGGSWRHLAQSKQYKKLLIRSMKRKLNEKNLGSHTDVYGRLFWDRPAVTIKRECAHVGNGRYVHPEQTRLLTVREMALLQGFPRTYAFNAASLANNYRHIGDAVPPLIAYQIASLIIWMKTGLRPNPEEWILPGTSLRVSDVATASRHTESKAANGSGLAGPISEPSVEGVYGRSLPRLHPANPLPVVAALR